MDKNNNIIENPISGITYSGKLSIKLKRGSKIFKSVKHNEGLAPLFQLICFTIAGNTVKTLIPTQIDICTADGTESRLTKPIYVSGGISVFKDSKNIDAFNNPLYGVRIRAMVQKKDVISLTQIEDGDYIFLKSTTANLARIALTEDDISALRTLSTQSGGIDGLVEWELKFSNSTTTI